MKTIDLKTKEIDLLLSYLEDYYIDEVYNNYFLYNNKFKSNIKELANYNLILSNGKKIKLNKDELSLFLMDISLIDLQFLNIIFKKFVKRNFKNSYISIMEYDKYW